MIRITAPSTPLLLTFSTMTWRTRNPGRLSPRAPGVTCLNLILQRMPSTTTTLSAGMRQEWDGPSVIMPASVITKLVLGASILPCWIPVPLPRLPGRSALAWTDMSIAWQQAFPWAELLIMVWKYAWGLIPGPSMKPLRMWIPGTSLASTTGC